MAFDGLTKKLNSVFSKLKSRGKLSESDIKDAMREVRLALLEADVNYKVAKDFVAAVSERAVGEEVMKSLTPAQQVIKIVNEELTALMGSGAREIKLNSKPPTVIMMCGLQGSGKTTHCAKLGKLFKKNGHRPLLVACDIYRPAAIEQLKIAGG
ncbi:MAG: signal recognition particle protein, partial [Ruminococcaceae bacterium]|nr:signal recognition particle protein [Oscillospiraceae bacterium]